MRMSNIRNKEESVLLKSDTESFYFRNTNQK